MKPTAADIIKDATRLQTEYFNQRDTDLLERRKIRFRELAPRIPASYKDTAVEYRSPVVQDEGTQLCSLIYAPPVWHLVPPRPEHQPLTTKVENFGNAFFQELECYHGSVWWKNTEAQVHQKISWIFSAPKRDAYAGGPKAPKADDLESLRTYGEENDAYKREHGLASQWDYRHVPTDTMYWVGPARNPYRVYEVKDVDEMELMAKYDLYKEGNRLRKKVEGTLPSGVREGQSSRNSLKVIEYWDKDWCMIVVKQGASGIFSREPDLVLDEWEHNWGRVPYFSAAAFENEVAEEHLKYESPLDPLIAEVPHYNDLRTMQRNVGTLRGYPTYMDVSQWNADAPLDAGTTRRTHEKFQPGVIYDLLPGHEIKNVPMEVGPELLQEVLASEARIHQFSLSDVSKGISPGADTANAAITQLRREQRSSLSPMNKNQADQWREASKFMLERIKDDIGETVYVYSEENGEMLDLSPEDIITMNLQVKVAPDSGQDMLIEEKHMAEMLGMGLFNPIVFYERAGYENPDEMLQAQISWQMFQSLLPELLLQLKANFGDTNALAQLIAANQQTGDANSAVEGLMQQAQQIQNGQPGMEQPTGAGQGSAGLPRQEGVRSPALQETTQPVGVA